jgi:hypothetical protein
MQCENGEGIVSSRFSAADPSMGKELGKDFVALDQGVRLRMKEYAGSMESILLRC